MKSSGMKSSSIKKTLPFLTWVMTVILSISMIPLVVIVQLYTQHKDQENSARETFGQLEQMIEINEKILDDSREEFSQKCIRAADMAAYFVEHYPETLLSLEHTRELAVKLGVDELHYFTPEGELYTGTHPEYYGYTFHSGEQMEFFLPMLRDRSLKLCQEITPNTAEGKEMQYAAVWMEDGSGILQIGMEPRHLQELIKDKSLENVLKMMPFEVNGHLHILDRESNRVIASTEDFMVGTDLSREMEMLEKADGLFSASHLDYAGQRFCIYMREYGDYLMIRSYLSQYPFWQMSSAIILFLCYSVLVACGVIGCIRWYVNGKMTRNLLRIIEELKKNENGKMENITLRTGIVEFDELLYYINHMLDNIRSSWDKITYIMDKGKIQIGILEKNLVYKKTFINQYMLDILDMEDGQAHSTQENVSRAQEKLQETEQMPVSLQEHVYEFNSRDYKKYLRIEKDVDEQSILYYVTDITNLWGEINQLRTKSVLDPLVNIYNRRGFGEKVGELFKTPETLGHAAMIMVDADNLKLVNDIYGHRAGDEYLKQIAALVKSTLGEKAVCARLGGDEFLCFVYGKRSRDQLEQLVETLKQKRGKPFLPDSGMEDSGTLQFSMGAAYYPDDHKDFHALMYLADEKMYQEKKERKTESCISIR